MEYYLLPRLKPSDIVKGITEMAEANTNLSPKYAAMKDYKNKKITSKQYYKRMSEIEKGG